MDRDAYVEKMKAKIDEWNAEIEKQEAKARVAQADMQLKYEDQVAEMKAQRDAFEAKLREARDSNEKAGAICAMVSRRRGMTWRALSTAR